MHSKKHRQVRKLRSRPKSRRGRSLKGGAPQPCVYEGTSLTEGNNLIQLAVTQMDGTYTFNPMGQHCTNYCDLEKYYCDNKSLACVNSVYANRGGSKEMTYPSLIQLLGLSLVLAKSHKFDTPALSTTITPEDISKTFIDTLSLLSAKNPLFNASMKGVCTTHDGKNFFEISGLTELEVNNILTIMKKLMFYSKYATVPDNNLNHLTFAKIFSTTTNDAIVHVQNQKIFNQSIAASNFGSKSKIYTPEQLRADATAAPAHVQASSSLEERVARLETAVAELQNK